jgi:transcriptional regulator with XRE-family HTH domain
MFKDKLKDNRTKLNLSQDELAQKIFVSRSAVAKWEQGRGIPEDESLNRLAGLFGIASDLLLTKEDMKEEVAQSEKNLDKSRKKSIIGFIVAGVSIGALAITLLSGAFVYGPTGEENTETLNVNGVTAHDGRVVNVDFESQGKIDYSYWQDAVFKDEFGTSVSSIEDLNLREGDRVEISYLKDANMFGAARIGSMGLSEIALKSHAFVSADALFGMGYSFLDQDFGEEPTFSSSADNVAYARFYEENPTSFSPSLDLETKNVYSITLSMAFHNTIKIGIAFDPDLVRGKVCWPFFNGYSNKWSRYFTDMETGNPSLDFGVYTLVFDSMSSFYVGAVPLKASPCGYGYVDYDVTVFAKKNPSYYEIESYDASDSLLGTEKVFPSTDVSSLSLPSGRSYSLVKEYRDGSLVSTSERIVKGGKTNLYFSNSFGFFDRDSSAVTL